MRGGGAAAPARGATAASPSAAPLYRPPGGNASAAAFSTSVVLGAPSSPMAASSPATRQPRLPPDKALGEFSELCANYEGSNRPARMGLCRALDAGKMRNPLQMRQSAAPWSARRPMSAGSCSGKASASRAVSAGRARGGLGGAWRSPGAPDGDRGGATGTAAQVVTTQGAGDRGPGVLRPQRIELPSYLNTPARGADGKPCAPDDRTATLRRVQDLELLTFACRRASKVREEDRAHFSLGVLRDNLGQYQKAIESYNQFLRVCKECNDSQGCALAYHCIAVNHQLLGGALSAENAKSSDRPDELRKAIYFHNKHR